MLDEPITIDELHKALSNVPNNKSPGPDGFPAESYKTSGKVCHHYLSHTPAVVHIRKAGSDAILLIFLHLLFQHFKKKESVPEILCFFTVNV